MRKIIVLAIIAISLTACASNETLEVAEKEYTTSNVSLEEIRKADALIKSFTDKTVVSNINNDQAEVILQALGIDIKDLELYSFASDVRIDRAYLIGVFKAKDNNKIAQKLRQLIIDKQNKLKELIEYSDEYKNDYENAQSAVISEKAGYVIIVMDKNTNALKLINKVA